MPRTIQKSKFLPHGMIGAKRLSAKASDTKKPEISKDPITDEISWPDTNMETLLKEAGLI
jgi:hypothetical protein